MAGRHSVFLIKQVFLIFCLAILSLSQVFAFGYTFNEGASDWVLVAQDNVPIYASPDAQAEPLQVAKRLTALDALGLHNSDWYRVYLGDESNQSGYVQTSNLISDPFIKSGDTVVLFKSGEKNITISDEIYPNIAFEIYVKGELVEHKSTLYPFLNNLSGVWTKPVALSGIDFVYVLNFGVDACAEPHGYLYFIWNGKTFSLLETGCLLCENRDYAVKDVILPEEEGMRDIVSIVYTWGDLDDTDSLVETQTKTDTYRWDGEKLNIL